MNDAETLKNAIREREKANKALDEKLNTAIEKTHKSRQEQTVK